MIPALRDIAAALLLGGALIGAMAGPSSKAAFAQPLTKEEEAKQKLLKQQQQQKQQQQPRRQDAPGQAGPRNAPNAPPQVQRPQAPPPFLPRTRPAQTDPNGAPPAGQVRPPQQRQPAFLPPPNNPSRPAAAPVPPPDQRQALPPRDTIPPREQGQFLPRRPSGAPGMPAGTGAPGAASGPFARPGTPIGAPVVGRPVTQPAGPVRLDQIKQSRIETVDSGGRKLIQEPGRTIIKQDNRLIIHKNETTNIQKFYPGARTIPIRGGISQTVYTRPDGLRVVTEVDGSGRMLRRYGQAPGGRQIVYVDNRRFYRNLAVGVGIAAVGVGAVLALSSPVVAMPRERYIVEYDRASDDDLYDVLVSPPIERLERVYSLEEVRYSRPLRERMRRIDLDTINFETGSFEVTEDQYGKLERMARAMGRAIEKNPAEVFLIEGHTDAVGTPEDNLSLSDRRAESIARILTEHFSIPIENLVTQGYGEQDLKVPTDGPERANRRAAVRRITPMLSQEGGSGVR
jgi:outer membrane protein OmpA-like peptidoglycan-associated protein